MISCQKLKIMLFNDQLEVAIFEKLRVLAGCFLEPSIGIHEKKYWITSYKGVYLVIFKLGTRVNSNFSELIYLEYKC